VIDIVRELRSYGAVVDVHDPWVDPVAAMDEYGMDLVAEPEKGSYDAIVLAVAHKEFKEMGDRGVRGFGNASSVVYDIKYLLPKAMSDDRL
jgi:UDP-N-acetyl-D-galactosamine dehydrogenase